MGFPAGVVLPALAGDGEVKVVGKDLCGGGGVVVLAHYKVGVAVGFPASAAQIGVRRVAAPDLEYGVQSLGFAIGQTVVVPVQVVADLEGQVGGDLLVQAVFAEAGGEDECHRVGLAGGVIDEGYRHMAAFAEGGVADDDQIFGAAAAAVGPFQKVRRADLRGKGGNVHSDGGAAPGQGGEESAVAGGGFNVSGPLDAGGGDKPLRQGDAFQGGAFAGVELVQGVAVAAAAVPADATDAVAVAADGAAVGRAGAGIATPGPGGGRAGAIRVRYQVRHARCRGRCGVAGRAGRGPGSSGRGKGYGRGR